MRIYKKKLNANDPDYCWLCGKPFSKDLFIINLGTYSSTFELCRSCARKIKNSLDHALNKKEK